MNAEDFMWRRAWSYIHERYVKIVKVRNCQAGFPIYDGQILSGVEQGRTHMFRETELANIQWIPYGSKR